MNFTSPSFQDCSSLLERPVDTARPSLSLDTSSIGPREKVILGESLPVRPSTTQPEALDTLIEDGGLSGQRRVRRRGDVLSSSFPLDRSFEPLTPQDEGYVTDQSLEEADEIRNNRPEGYQQKSGGPGFLDLPPEILRSILDDIFGSVSSITSSALVGRSGLRSINTLMRHPRRKTLSDLALVCSALRELVQERIYRQIKIKGTQQSLDECREWFLDHPHLTRHVRHVEYWVPVWGNKTLMPPLPSSLLPNDNDIFGHQNALIRTAADRLEESPVTSYTFERATQNATLNDIFNQVHMLFPEARILTLEGGHCKKPPMITHFRPHEERYFATLRNIRTLVMRGTWNIMRQFEHWRNIQDALPNLQEWHCAYAKHKLESYPMISKILLTLPSTVLHVSLSLEGFYSKPESSNIYNSPPPNHHLCELLGRIAPRLESLTYSGRICSCFFTSACRALRSTKEESRLQSLDLVVKSCCPPHLSLADNDLAPATTQATLSDPLSTATDTTSVPPTLTLLPVGGTSEIAGISNMTFIRAFERLTLGAVSSLSLFPLLSYIRIRFIDLDSACPLLNPYFQLIDGRCNGLWNEDILDVLSKARPGVEYEELTEGICPQWGKGDVIVGAVYPRTRPRAINSGAYRILASTR